MGPRSVGKEVANARELGRRGPCPTFGYRKHSALAPGPACAQQAVIRPQLGRPRVAKEEATRGGPLNSTLAPTTTRTATLPPALDRAALCARIGEENKAKNVLVLDMRGITPLYDFFVLLTGSSRRQIHTIAEEIDAVMRGMGDERLSIQGYQASRWVVQDYGDVVVHVFDAEAREYYNLEDLWADAPRVDWKRE